MKTLDVCGVVAEVSANEIVNLKKGNQKVRKYVTLVDDTGYAISLTLWATMCVRITNDDLHKVIAVKGARVSEFGGKSLNAADDHSSLFTELNHERFRHLYKWYSEIKSAGKSEIGTFRNLTQKQNRNEGLTG